MATAEAEVPVVEYLPGAQLPVLGNAGRIDRFREMAPIVRSTSTPAGFWVVADGEAAREVLQNPKLFSSTASTVTDPEPTYLWVPQMLDPPRHTAWRQHLGPYFSPGNMRRLEESVSTRCLELLDGMAERGRCDFNAEFAQRFPTSIFMDMFGLPIEELDQFLHWEHQILHLTPEEDPDRSGAIAAMVEVMGYFDELIASRRKDPHDDILSDSIAWEIDGEPIPHDELLSFCLLMFMAGLDTVTIQLNYSFWHLAMHPADRSRIVEDPELIPSAIEELLRFYSFVPTGRKIMEDVDFHGCPLRAGDMIYAPVSAMCRDPKLFPNADEVVLDRKPNPHIAFGAGPHRCVGATLARRELRVAMEEWHRRIPHYRLPEGFEGSEQGSMHGINALQLEWD